MARQYQQGVQIWKLVSHLSDSDKCETNFHFAPCSYGRATACATRLDTSDASRVQRIGIVHNNPRCYCDLSLNLLMG